MTRSYWTPWPAPTRPNRHASSASGLPSSRADSDVVALGDAGVIWQGWADLVEPCRVVDVEAVD